MNIKTLPVGLIDTNCYFVHLPEKRQLYVIDPGGDAAEIVAVARSFDFDRVEILLTHAHVDHISAAREVARALGIDCVRLAAADHPLYASPENALLPWLPAAKNLPPAKEFAPNDDFTVIPLPGHTPGGSGLLFPSGNALFVGDTLFAGSVGRTDLPGGDYHSLMESIHSRLLTLADDLNVYPGHGLATTIGRERATNPYLQD